MSSSMLSPCVAQPGIAGTSAQKPPSSASCTTILIFILPSPPTDFRAATGQIQALPAVESLRRLRVDLCRHLPDRAGELLGGLGAGDGVFVGKDKRRHAGNSLVGGVLGLRRDQLDVLVGG